MTTSIALTLLGFGLGALIVANRRTDPRTSMTLRERAIEAQRISESASQHARDLVAQWNVEQDRKQKGWM